MATIVLSAAGAAAGTSIGGGVMGIGSAVIGRAVGATVGRVLDQTLLGSGSEPVETGRVDRFRLAGAGPGAPIPRVYGAMRVSGQVIWASRFQETSRTSGGSGKGGSRAAQPEVTSYSYSVSLAIALCEGEIGRVGRVWADGAEISPADLDMDVYPGSAAQLPDPKIVAVEGAAPAYRGLAYVVIKDLQLAPYGNRVPQFSFEVVRPEPATLAVDSPDMARAVRGVAMMPGTGEYALATTPVRYEADPGTGRYINVNTPSGLSDFATSVDAMTGDLPNCRAASLIVSWFGNDLRCGTCQIAPKVEQREHDGAEMPWRVSGVPRAQAGTVPRVDGQPVYGGTPSDGSVIEAIRDLRDAGQAVMFYPFILMEQMAGNALTDPWTQRAGQPVLPWRGRITTSLAPGVPGTPDRSARAADEVEAFFGAARPKHFSPEGDTVRYDGPAGWSYRRFILHYAFLCAAAGGVDSFCIGSEMRSLTQIRDVDGFPAVEAMRQLARDVREILGPETKIGYAADWSEYFGYHPQDGSGDVFFHLDPLWSDPSIDFIGIDNYMPLSDWRDGDDHADADWPAIHDLGYLKSNVAGGELFDWYYPSDADRDAQRRVPITDGSHAEPWVFRIKDVRSWWSRPHHERRGGIRSQTATAWIPQSKPVWFTELGCAAIDKGTNQPNKFVDPKSSESALPYYSSGHRDDPMQAQYLRAMDAFWADAANNPVSEIYGGRMVDMTRAFVWAWDARPFPHFPGNDELWRDAANYGRGHWITGRSSGRGLSSVVREICAEAGVPDVDTSRLYGLVRGYSQASVDTGRAALQPLLLARGADAIERDGSLRFRSRSAHVDASLTREDIVADEGGDVALTRTPQAEGPGRVRLTYLGAEASYEVETAEATSPNDSDASVAQTDVPMVLADGDAQRIVERWLAEARLSRETIAISLPPSRRSLGAGDVFRFEGSRWRIDRVERDEAQSIVATRVEPGLYRSGLAGIAGRRRLRHVAPVPPLAVFLDLPLMRGDEAPHAPHIAVAARPWPGPVAVYRAPGEERFALDQTLGRAAVIGTTETPLFAAPIGRLDRGPALQVRLISGALERIGARDLLAGGNLVGIGSGRDDVWELFQFAEAEPLGAGRFAVWSRLRGQLGTDAVMPPVWPAGSRLVLIDGAVRQVGLSPAERGQERTWRIGPASRALSDPLFGQQVRSFEGAGLRPYAPVHLRIAERASGDLQVSWIRRTRIDGDSWTGLDVPLGEAREAYLVRVLRDGEVVREAMTNAPAWTYDAAAQAADDRGGMREVAVAQISEKFGPGPFRSVHLA